jgi:MFS family permease
MVRAAAGSTETTGGDDPLVVRDLQPRDHEDHLPPRLLGLVAPFVGVPDLDHRIWLLTLTRFVVTAGFSAVMPFLAMHLAVDRHVSVLHIGGLWAVSGALSAALQWVAGHLADRLGRRPVLLVGMAARSLNLLALGYAIDTHASFSAIAFLFVVNGAMRAFYDPVAWSVVAALSTGEQRLAAFSVHRVGSSLGWVAGPMLAAMGSSLPFAVLFYVAAPLTLMAALPAAYIPETRPQEARSRPAGRTRLRDLLGSRPDPAFVRFMAGTLAYFFLQTQLYHLLAIFAAKHLGLGRGDVASLLTVNAVLVVLLQLPSVRFIHRLGARRSLVVGSLGYVAAFAVCGAAQGLASLVIGVVLITLCEILAAPAQQARVTAFAPAGRMGRYAGAYGLVQGAAQTAGPAAGVLLMDAFSPRTAWFALAILGFVAAWFYARVRDVGPGL